MSNLNISLIQTSLHWENKPVNLEMLGKKIESIPGKTELIILPEMFSTGFSMENVRLAETMSGPTLEWMKKTAAGKGAIITGSIIVREGDGHESKFYNRLIWMLPTGEYGFYDKRHLFAYGKEDQHYTPGKKRLIASVNGWKINLQICYDLRFPVWSRQSPAETKQPEYDLLIYVANWPTARVHAWRTLLQARAIENQSFVIGVNRTGIDGRGLEYPGESMVVDPLGAPLQVLGASEEIYSLILERGKLDDIRMKFPFLRDADSFQIQP
jgi:omega-amidase